MQCDYANNVLRRFNTTSGEVTTLTPVVDLGQQPLFHPVGIAIDANVTFVIVVSFPAQRSLFRNCVEPHAFSACFRGTREATLFERSTSLRPSWLLLLVSSTGRALQTGQAQQRTSSIPTVSRWMQWQLLHLWWVLRFVMSIGLNLSAASLACAGADR